MHWPIDAALLRPLIPSSLEIEEFDGTAWIGVIPFTMWGIRATGTPPLPGAGEFHEMNVRTYVRHPSESGVWFFSLDAAHRLAVLTARATFSLPYFFARMRLHRAGDLIDYASRRDDRRSAPAHFQARWSAGASRASSRPGSLDYFLTERYCLFAQRGRRLLRARIWHRRWPLRSARVEHWESSMVAAAGLPEPAGEPILHHADELHVRIWRPTVIGDVEATR